MSKYIDAEKLVNIFNTKGDMATGTPKAVFYNAAKIVEALPTADVAPVKHGTWQYMGLCLKCSECGLSIYIGSYDKRTLKCQANARHYCERCGAKMDNKGDVNNV